MLFRTHVYFPKQVVLQRHKTPPSFRIGEPDADRGVLQVIIALCSTWAARPEAPRLSERPTA